MKILQKVLTKGRNYDNLTTLNIYGGLAQFG